MRITISRTGGFAGIRPPPTVLDTSALAAETQTQIEKLVAAADFFGLPEKIAAKAGTADQFVHQITITRDDGHAHTVTFDATSASPALLDLAHLVRNPATASLQ